VLDCGMGTPREEHVFVLRVWKEAATSRVGWRATIVHVASGCSVAATELRDINDFIRLRIAPPDGLPPDG
jgi:hypothetical protein